MTATAKTTRKTVAELLAEHAQDLSPSDGDKAYTFYHGKAWEGILKQIPIVDGWGGGWIIIPPNGQKRFEGGDMPYLPRNIKGMEDVASVDVYAPDSWAADHEDDWHERIKEMGYETPNQMVAYDTKRGMFYLRAHED